MGNGKAKSVVNGGHFKAYRMDCEGIALSQAAIECEAALSVETGRLKKENTRQSGRSSN